MTGNSLWGEVKPIAATHSPILLLREQASLLTKMTSGVLAGDVRVRQSEASNEVPGLVAALYVVAPLLNDYEVKVVDVEFSPTGEFKTRVRGIRGERKTCYDDEGVKNTLRNILSSDDVKKIVEGLLASSQGVSESSTMPA